jgi:arylsulfatase A-like enzyme
MLNKLVITTLGIVPVLTDNGQSVQNKPSQPNIVLLLADDLGWKDFGFVGSNFYGISNINELLRQEMVFTNAYTACAVCSSTRAYL